MSSEYIRYDKDAQNIVTLTLDMPGRPVNVIGPEFDAAFGAVLARLTTDAPIAGVILTSAKKTFVAGADVDWLFQMTDPKEVFRLLEPMKAKMRRLETLGFPVVAAINGSALGGGLELTLACHYRIAIDDPRSKLGLPEVTLGLLPGGGGVTRLTRMLGLEKAAPYLGEGTQVDPRAAKAAGIIDELVADRADMLAKAKTWILAHPQAAQPWDQKGFRIPGGEPSHPKVAQMLAIAPAMLRKKTYRNYPAPEAILSAMAEGAAVDFDTASRIETRYFAQIATGPIAKNMLTAFWYQLNTINGGGSRPAGIEPTDTHTVGVLGAGMMGHGIAYVTALSGMEVALKDVTAQQAEAGQSRIAALMNKRVARGSMTEAERDAILARIRPTAAAADLAGCDLIVEAVFEDRELKARVTQEAEAQIAADAVFASNTSTMPITSLAARSARPENFIGLHFFSPVDKMRLVEIIVGKATSARTLAVAFDYVLKIRKIPIVVNDSRGFYTSRVFGSYVNEGMALLAEGQPPRAIESAGLQAGLPVGPLAVMDEVNLGLVLHIQEQTERDLAATGQQAPYHPANDVLRLMVKERGRPGRAQGAGFYEYPPAGEKFLWRGLAELFPPRGEKLSQVEMIERMMFAQALETARCYEEGVLTSVADANIGSIFGWGFPAFQGGTLQYINACGLPAFVQRSRELAAKYGPRFAPPEILVKMAAEGRTF